MFLGSFGMLKLKEYIFKMMDAALYALSLSIPIEYRFQTLMIAVNIPESGNKILQIGCVKGSVYEIYGL